MAQGRIPPQQQRPMPMRPPGAAGQVIDALNEMDPTPHLKKMLEQHQLMVVQWYCFSGCCCIFNVYGWVTEELISFLSCELKQLNFDPCILIYSSASRSLVFITVSFKLIYFFITEKHDNSQCRLCVYSGNWVKSVKRCRNQMKTKVESDVY